MRYFGVPELFLNNTQTYGPCLLYTSFENGVCKICGNGCAHTDVDDGGVCRNCKTQMAVKSETGGTVTYGTDFKACLLYTSRCV